MDILKKKTQEQKPQLNEQENKPIIQVVKDGDLDPLETNEWLESNNVQDMRSLRTKMIDTESDFTQNLIDVYVALVREDYVERMELGTTVESKDQVDDILGDKEKLLHFYESVESDIPGEEIEELAQEFENLGGRNKTRLKTLRRKIIECIVDLKPMLSEGIEGEEAA